MKRGATIQTILQEYFNGVFNAIGMAKGFRMVRNRFQLTAVIIIGAALIGALIYAPSERLETNTNWAKQVRTIPIKPSWDSGVAGNTSGERKEGEISKGVYDLLYRYRQ